MDWIVYDAVALIVFVVIVGIEQYQKHKGDD